MTDYDMKIRIDPHLSAKLIQMKMSLCCAFEYQVDESASKYNIVASAQMPLPITHVRWRDTYWMTASEQGLPDGPKYPVDGNVTPLLIKAGQVFQLSSDWTARVQQDPQVLENNASAMRFETATNAAGILCKEIADIKRPVYVISIGKSPMIPGQYDVVPTGEIRIFFSTQIAGTAYTMDASDKTGAVFSYFGFENPEVNFMSTDTYNIKLNETGTFCFVQPVMDQGASSFIAVVNNQLNQAVPVHLKVDGTT